MQRTECHQRLHQVKVSLCEADAADIISLAREEGVGRGTYLRRLALRHLMALTKASVSAARPAVTRDRDTRKFGMHISVLLTEPEYADFQRLAADVQLTVSGYLGRCVVERWLLARRRRIDAGSGQAGLKTTS
jgi:hypothetical protein